MTVEQGSSMVDTAATAMATSTTAVLEHGETVVLATTTTATATTAADNNDSGEQAAQASMVVMTESTTITTTATEHVDAVVAVEDTKMDAALHKQCLLFPTYATWSARGGVDEEDEPHVDGEWTVKANGWIFSSPKKSRRRRIAMGMVRVLGGMSRTDKSYTRLEERSRMFFATSAINQPVHIQVVGVTAATHFELDGDPANRSPHTGSTVVANDEDDAGDDDEAEVKAESDPTVDDEDDEDDDTVLEPPRPPTPVGAPAMEVADDDGYIRGNLRIPEELVHEWRSSPENSPDRQLLKLRAFFADLPNEPTYGVVNLIGPHGISVISDIDDTIKMTGILDGVKTVVGNTFFRKTRDVPGMADVYNDWYRQGVEFHYVSNGPWQLYPMLDQFFREHQFPPGAAHLRMFDGLSDVLNGTPGQTKQDRIIDIFRDFPHRRFILIGDTGEKDPEVYADIARRFPDRVAYIFIHDVTTPNLLKDIKEHMQEAAEPFKHSKSTVTEGQVVATRKAGEEEAAPVEASVGERIRQNLSWFKHQVFSDLTKSSRTVSDMFDWSEDHLEQIDGELGEKVDKLVGKTRSAMEKFRQRIHDVFDGIHDWELFTEARIMLHQEHVKRALIDMTTPQKSA